MKTNDKTRIAGNFQFIPAEEAEGPGRLEVRVEADLPPLNGDTAENRATQLAGALAQAMFKGAGCWVCTATEPGEER